MSSSCVPRSMIRPSWSTQISSALRMVDSLWATAMVVRVFINFAKASCTNRSLSVSRADVASSSMRIGGFFKMARAMLTRCRWPPESLPPRSPMLVLKPSSLCIIKSKAFAIRAASATCSSVASEVPNLILFLKVSLNRMASWFTLPMRRRKS